jgi:hypothetical protein
MVEENLASNPHAKDSATRPIGFWQGNSTAVNDVIIAGVNLAEMRVAS